eukprot:2749416-Rhodomonas_salina.3
MHVVTDPSWLISVVSAVARYQSTLLLPSVHITAAAARYQRTLLTPRGRFLTWAASPLPPTWSPRCEKTRFRTPSCSSNVLSPRYKQHQQRAASVLISPPARSAAKSATHIRNPRAVLLAMLNFRGRR